MPNELITRLQAMQMIMFSALEFIFLVISGRAPAIARSCITSLPSSCRRRRAISPG